MAVTDFLEGQAPAQATNADAKAKSNEIKEVGLAEHDKLTADQKNLEGSKSNTIKFLNAIGHDGMNVTVKNQPGKKTIGYKLQNVGDAPIQVPVAPYKSRNVCEATLPATFRTVQAGEIFVVNLVEAGILASQLEYAGKFTGDGYEVRFTPKAQKDSTLPLVTFKAKEGNIKDGMEVIGGQKDAEGNVILDPIYETSFRAVFVKRVSGTRVKKEKNDTFAINAAAFRSFIAKASV